MNILKKIICPKFNPKIKSFIISDGENKMLLARQFIEITKMELQNLHTMFIIELSSNESYKEGSNSLTVFTKQNNTYHFLPYQAENRRLYYVLITEKDFNIFESKEILKTASSFINSLILKEKNKCNKNSKEIIHDKAIDIILALDDIINPILGSEGLTLGKLEENLKMFSFEEEDYKKKKEEKISKAHDELLKGMEEIEKQKYLNTYNPNSISNEDIEKEQKEIEEKEKIRKEIEGQRERFRRMMGLGGMNLRRIRRDEGIHEFISACENMVQTMMLRQIIAAQQQEDDDEEASDEEGAFSNVRLIVTPLNVYYTGQRQNRRINTYFFDGD